MSLGAAQTAAAIRAASAELARIWRQARLQARAGVFPGLIEGVVPDFLDRAAAALETGADPATVWAATTGAVRVDPRERRRSAAEIEAEWTIFGAVLDAVCEALSTDAAVRERLAAAVASARAGAADIAEGRGPNGVVVALALSGTGPARRMEG